MEPQQPPVQVTPLRAAIRHALDIARGHHYDELDPYIPHIVVDCVIVDQATALASFIQSEADVSMWATDCLKRLKRVAIVDRLLTIVGSAIIPILSDSPLDQRACEELRRYAFRVKDCARIVGGPFGKKPTASPIGFSITPIKSRRCPLVALPSLVRNARDIRKVIKQFRGSRFLLWKLMETAVLAVSSSHQYICAMLKPSESSFSIRL